MRLIKNSKAAARVAGLELNALAAAGAIPEARLAEGHVAAAGTPVHDLNGEILFYRVPVRGKTTHAFADIASFPGFGETLLRVAHGMAWDPTALIAAAEAAATRQARRFRYDVARFVAYSYPKIAVQFLKDDQEVVMIELGSDAIVPAAKRRGTDEPPGNLERWSLIAERPPHKAADGEKRISKRLDAWDEICPPERPPRGFEPRMIKPEIFRRAFEPRLRISVETRQVAYSPVEGDHAPCFELRGQLTGVWCVAASVQMLLDFYRYNYEQTRIAADLGLGTLTNPNGLPYANDAMVVTVLEALSNNALDASMDTTPTWDEFRAEIRANRPMVSFIPGHSRAVAGFTATRVFSWYMFRGLLVYDPWPPTTGVITQWENFDAMTYRRTFTAQLSLAAAETAARRRVREEVPV